MDLIESIKISASIIAACGTVLGTVWGITRIVLVVYDHVKDVARLKEDSIKLRKADKDIKYGTYRLLQQNKDLLSSLQKSVTELRQELLKIAIKCNLTEPKFRDDD